jgi:hypothetical protein
MTTIHSYGPTANGSASAKLTPLPIGALAIATWNLLEEAGPLPMPTLLSIYDSQRIDLQFPRNAKIIDRWAHRFSATVTSTLLKDNGEGPRTLYRADFDYHGIRVCAYAVLPGRTARS